MIGRIGCIIKGCCYGRACEAAWYALQDSAGQPRLPVVPLEMAFNGVMLVVLIALRRTWGATGQLFHVYMIAYGLYRFAAEFMRERTVLCGGLDAYQVTALCVLALGAYRYAARARELQSAKAA
jgi:phosphatidylglycerol:prolipoprotein diacylglycerol transferase